MGALPWCLVFLLTTRALNCLGLLFSLPVHREAVDVAEDDELLS